MIVAGLVTPSGDLDEDSVVGWGPLAAGSYSSLPTTYVNQTQLTATVSASLIAAQGSANITVVNPDSTASNAASFTITQAPPTTVSGSIAHIASGGGWQSTLTFVNTGNASAQVQLSFFDDNGNALSLPFTVVPSSSNTTATTLTQTIAAGASLQVVTQSGSTTALVGSAHLSTTGSINGFTIFRYNPSGQEAVVPLETHNAGSYLIAFDNTNSLGTGVALANISTQAAAIPVVIRDDSGVQIATDTIHLAAQGHTSFMLAVNYGITQGKRGVIEFRTPALGQIAAVGLRANGSALTTLPVIEVGTAGTNSTAVQQLTQRLRLQVIR